MSVARSSSNDKMSGTKSSFFPRRQSREVKVGDLIIGGNNPVVVQGMTKSPSDQPEQIIAEVMQMEAAGCRLARLSVPDMNAARVFGQVKQAVKIPLIADIHFDYRLALAVLEQGADKIRLNPGNLRNEQEIRTVVRACRKGKVPIRVGVNAGSLEPALLKKYGGVTPEALAQSALKEVALLEQEDFCEIIVSVKSFEVPLTLATYRLLAEKVDYPFHIGITEAGPGWRGVVRSSVGIGLLLAEGLGDTLRVSLTAPSVEEIWAAREILKSLEMAQGGLTLVSCPGCGRKEYDVEAIAREVEKSLAGIKIPLKVAVMGCPVNGPGEARGADIGIAGGLKQGILFKQGKILKKLPVKDALGELLKEVEIIIQEREKLL